ncbi:MAG: NADH-quinone oxidoreductase subunit A [Holosporales bacterium]|jgi:NADH:ubiquinone oxidoreductase subunit 3 (subunit A)|nr:NADH-quinone oxidoreductase subunit A [Holosporales bacterium]
MNNFVIVLAVAGIIPISILLFSNVSKLLKKGDEKVISLYECGFKNKSPAFTYMTENTLFIRLFLIAELAVTVLLIFCAFMIIDKSWNGIPFINVLLTILVISILGAFKWK